MTQAQNTQDITIFGGGIMGLMAAYMLAKDHRVTIYDPKGFPGRNASYMAGGMLAPYAEIEHMSLEWVEAGLKSIDIWQDIPLETGFTQGGSLLIAHPEDRYILERFQSHLPPALRAHRDVHPLEAQLSQHHPRGLFLEEEAHLDPAKTMAALCEHLKQHKNVSLNTQEASPDPNTLTLDCRGMGANNDKLRGVKGETLIVRNTELSLKRPIRLMHPRYPLYIIPREDHVFMIGATVIESDTDEHVSLRSSMELMSALYALHPSFADANIIEMKAGIRPSHKDNLPRITITENLIQCNGLFRHGYLLAPIMAQCVKDYLHGHSNPYMGLFNDTTDQKGAAHESHDQRAA